MSKFNEDDLETRLSMLKNPQNDDDEDRVDLENQTLNDKDFEKNSNLERLNRSISIESLNSGEQPNGFESNKKITRFEKLKRFSKEQLLIPKLLYLLMFLSVGSLLPYIPLILKAKDLTITQIGIFLSIDRLSRGNI